MTNAITFGDDFNPATSSINVQPGQSFRCPCGCEKSTGNPWLMAHWQELLQAKCDNCGQEFSVHAGRIKLMKPEKWQEVAK